MVQSAICYDSGMQSDSPDTARTLRIAAWMWIGYLVALAFVDANIYVRGPLFPIASYFVANVLVALIFMALAYWQGLDKMLGVLFMPLMISLIGGVPIVLHHLFVPRFPPGPLANAEGMALRQLPILFIGLVLVAWQYRLNAVVIFSLGTAILELGTITLFKRMPPDNYTIFFFIIVIRTVSFLVVGVFISQLMTRLRAQQESLRQANAQLTRYASTLEQLTVSRERNRLARELHDTLAHTLSGLTVQLETAKAYWDVNPQTAYQLLAQSLSATRLGLDETRRALKALRASGLEDLGMLLALQKLSETAAERGKLSLDLSLPQQIPSLSPDLEQCIYRVAQEAIENVINHANAENLAVMLTVNEAGIILTVQDDGLGLNVEQTEQAGHFGLAGMHERAQLVGGKLTISSQPNQGTLVQLALKG